MHSEHSSPLAIVFIAALLAAPVTTVALIATDPLKTTSQPTVDTVARFLESAQPALTEYRALRHLEASSRGGKMTGQLDAWTKLKADGTFTFEVVQESGSNLIRERVLHAALLEEQQNYDNDRLGESAFTRDNYNFQLDESARDGDLVRIDLAPRRKSQLLITGAAFVRRDDADLVKIEGILSKRPSFWTRKVQMTRQYARINGVRVPIDVRLDADVKLVGDSTFEMTYQYQTINGRQTDSN